MASRWQKYIKNKLGNLLPEDDDQRARKKVFKFMNRHSPAILKVVDFKQLLGEVSKNHKNDAENVLKGKINDHPSELVKYAPRILSKISSTQLFDWASQDDIIFEAILESSRLRRRIEKYIKSTDDEIDQVQCYSVSKKARIWNKLNPENRWWTAFRFLPFVERLIQDAKNNLYDKSPLFKAKIDGVSLFEVASNNTQYFNGFLSDNNNTSNNCLFRKLTKKLNDDQLKEILAGDQWDDRLKNYINDNNLIQSDFMSVDLSASTLLDEDLEQERLRLEKEEQERRQQEEEEQKRLEEEERKRLEEEQRLMEEERLRLEKEEQERRQQEEEERLRLEKEEQERLQLEKEAEERKRLREEEKARKERVQKKAREDLEIAVSKWRQKNLEKKLQEEKNKPLEEKGKAEKEEIHKEDEAQFYNYVEHPDVKEFKWDKSKDYLATHAKNTSFERNNNPHDQFKRDIHMFREMFKSPGSKEFGGQLSARMIKKLLFVMAHTNPMYKRDGQWFYFSESHEADKNVPIASLLSHTVRMTIELPPIGEGGEDLGAEFFKNFLWEGNPNRRHAATHGAVVRPKPEKTRDGILKNVDEIKPGKIETGINAAKDFVGGFLGVEKGDEGHYGSNLALGGDGNMHFLSQRVINDKGENGHLYMYYKPPTEKEPGAIVVGIEQSAPADTASPDVVYFPGSVYDNQGGGHDVFGTPNHFSATAGDHLGKPPKFHKKDESYEGIQKYGPDKYYNSMYLRLNRDQLGWIMSKYNNKEFEELHIDRPPVGAIASLGNYEKEQASIKTTKKTATFWGRFFEYGDQKSDDELVEDLVGEFKLIEHDDEKFALDIVNQAKAAMQKYIEKANIKETDKEKMKYFVQELSELRNEAHLIEIIHEMEVIKINTENDSSKSIRQLITEKGGQCLSDEVRKNLKIDAGPDQDVHGTVFGGEGFLMGYINILYTGSDIHFKDQLIEAHQALIQILPEYTAHAKPKDDNISSL